MGGNYGRWSMVNDDRKWFITSCVVKGVIIGLRRNEILVKIITIVRRTIMIIVHVVVVVVDTVTFTGGIRRGVAVRGECVVGDLVIVVNLWRRGRRSRRDFHFFRVDGIRFPNVAGGDTF